MDPRAANKKTSEGTLAVCCSITRVNDPSECEARLTGVGWYETSDFSLAGLTSGLFSMFEYPLYLSEPCWQSSTFPRWERFQNGVSFSKELRVSMNRPVCTIVREIKREPEKQAMNLVPASDGSGPYLQRDYWAVIKGCHLSCKEVAEMVKKRFTDFPPESLVVFRRLDNTDKQLELGDDLEVKIRMSGKTAVRVIHSDANSITLGTLEGHPEAGRITFGTYRNERGDVIFHIRSRARSSSSKIYAGFIVSGEPMQTNTWTDFIDRLAHTVGEGVIGSIQAETTEIDEEDSNMMDCPTFIASGE